MCHVSAELWCSDGRMQLYRKPFSNISGVEPAILVNSLSGFLRSLQIPYEDVWPLKTHLKEIDTKVNTIKFLKYLPLLR